MKMPYHGICAAALVLLAGCQGSKPRMEAVASSDQLEPLWSMKVACDGGLRIAGQKVVLQRRSGGQYERWTLDAATGRVLEFPHGLVKREGTPEDSHSDVEDGTSKPLNRSKVASVTPSGFEP